MERDQSGDPIAWREAGEEEPEDPVGRVVSERDEGDRSGPTWRGLLIAVIAAIVLSVGATLLLGGTYGFTRQGAAGGCGSGVPGDCCAPPEGR